MNTSRMKISQKGENRFADWNVHVSDGLVKGNSSIWGACFVSADTVKEFGLPIKDYFIWVMTQNTH